MCTQIRVNEVTCVKIFVWSYIDIHWFAEH